MDDRGAWGSKQATRSLVFSGKSIIERLYPGERIAGIRYCIKWIQWNCEYISVETMLGGNLAA